MIKCVIIEDEPQAVTLLKNIISSKYPDIHVLADFDKISVATAFIKENKLDFIFLDVQLNGELGIDIANYLSKEELNFDIIFTTAYGGFAVEAFALSAIDYVLKPIREERLAESIDRVIKKHKVSIEQLKILQEVSTNKKIEKIVLSMNEKKVFIKTEDIVFLKADNVYTEVYLTNKERYVVSKPLKEYEALLSQENFFKPHRSYIINTNFVKGYLKSSLEIEMTNGTYVSVSRERKKDFEERLSF